MNLYVFNGSRDKSEYGVAVVYAHTADEARKLLLDADGEGPDVTLARTVYMSRNPKAQVVARYFE